MDNLDHLFERNREWAQRTREKDPTFFQRLAEMQAPEYLWIGCADSRVPATEIVDLLPGEIFVHRNVANVVVHTDLNCLSVVQFAVDMLKVKHIIVVGHYGCGGVRAALEGLNIGLADNWLRHVQDVHLRHQYMVDTAPPEIRVDLMCELNVMEQVAHLCQTTVMRDAWARRQDITVHGWVYGLTDGLVNDLKISVRRPEELGECYATCRMRIRERYNLPAV